MKPISLKIKAFGPYLEEQYIDFTKFYTTNLFLIHGETGSGKTAILDAITYALYGKSSGGGRGDISQMRCDRADNKTETIVEYEFTIRDVVYRFDRRIRCTAGGKLQVSQNAFIKRNEVYEQLGENDNQTTVISEAERVIGLNYDQFRQVIILPQGQFENFLVAKSDVKEAILNTLFNAEQWSRITNRLWEKSHEMEQTLKSEENLIKNTLNEHKCEDIDMFRTFIKNVEIESEMIDKNIKSFKLIQNQVQVKLEHGKYINSRFDELNNLHRKLNELKSKENDIKTKRKQYADALTALKIKPLYLTYLKSETNYKRRADYVAVTEKQYNDTVKLCESYVSELEKIKVYQPDYDNKSKLLMKYNELVSVYKNYEIRKTDLNNLRIESYKMIKTAEDNEKTLQIDNDLRKRLSDERDYIIEQYSVVLPDLRQRVDELYKTQKLITEHDKIFTDIKELNERMKDKNNLLEINRENLNKLKSDYQTKYVLYIANAAALLADNLQEGVPCPVCGSINHPSPHETNNDESVTSEQLKSANEKINKITDNINIISADIEKINIKLQTSNENLYEIKLMIENSVTFTHVILNEAEEKLNHAVKECGKLEGISQQIKNLNENITRLNELMKDYEPKKVELKEKFDLAMAECQAMKLQMDDKIPDSTMLADKISELSSYVKRYEKALDSATEKYNETVSLCNRYDENLKIARDELKNAESEMTSYHTEYIEMLQTGGFTDIDEFLIALDDSQNAENLEREIKEYDNLQYNLTSNVASFIELLKAETIHDVESLSAELEKITNQLDDYIGKQGLYKNAVINYKKTLDNLDELSKELTIKRAKYEKINTFATSLNGIRGIGLSRYVLGIMLSAVIHEANILLQNAHGGRYSLRHTLNSSGRNHKSGLEIEVYDSYTDKTRWAATLSGGEKFLVALTLSLGLSSVVQLQSGGIKIDAIFVDEGFGTLDPSSVDDALTILRDINVTRSMVGIISHVELLKSNLEAHIEVEKKRNGSVLRYKYFTTQ